MRPDELTRHVTFQEPLAGLVVGPYRNNTAPFVAAATLVPHGRRAVWMVLAKPEFVTPEIAARLLAVVCAHHQVPLLHPVLHPRREAPGSALLMPNGVFGDMRAAFSQEITGELNRVASKLIEEHAEFVAHVTSALKGVRPPTFAPLPMNLPVKDPADENSWAPLPPSISVDPARLKPYDDREALFRLVAYDYSNERYLRELNDAELADRAVDALVNAYSLEEPSTVLLDVDEPAVVRSLARLGEASTENQLRHGVNQAAWVEQLATRWALPDSAGPLVASVKRWISSFVGQPTSGFVRYGQLPHLAAMLDEGRIRLTPASAYEDPSLGRARRADELSLEVHVDAKRSTFEILDETRAQSGDLFTPLSAKITKRALSDFLVYCASRRITARLFYDFDADACLFVRDEDEFSRRLLGALEESHPGWTLSRHDVTYVDPFARNAQHATIPFCKPWRFEYQHEYRIVLVPPTAVERLTALEVTLGPLSDIAELFLPDGSP